MQNIVKLVKWSREKNCEICLLVAKKNTQNVSISCMKKNHFVGHLWKSIVDSKCKIFWKRLNFFGRGNFPYIIFFCAWFQSFGYESCHYTLNVYLNFLTYYKSSYYLQSLIIELFFVSIVCFLLMLHAKHFFTKLLMDIEVDGLYLFIRFNLLLFIECIFWKWEVYIDLNSK